MFNFIYSVLKVNVYSTFFKQSNKLFVAKDLKNYRTFNWLYIKLYNAGNLITYLHKLSIDSFNLISVFRFAFLFIIVFFLGFLCWLIW